jgi:hypothetical protein
MTQQEKIDAINDYVMRHMPWCDFGLSSFDGFELVVTGSIDQSSTVHQIALTFRQVKFIGCHESWHTDTTRRFLRIRDPLDRCERMPVVEIGHLLFELTPEDFDYPFFIVAQSVEFAAAGA